MWIRVNVDQGGSWQEEQDGANRVVTAFTDEPVTVRYGSVSLYNGHNIYLDDITSVTMYPGDP